MTAADNAALARRWFEEVWNQRRTETARELIAPDAVCHSEGGTLAGPDAFIDQVHTPFLAAFPDLRIDVEGTVSEGDQVVVRWRARGTHTGEGFGVHPTGKRVSFRGMTWIRYRNRTMVEGCDCWNLTALVTALESGESVASVSLE